jgi:hypothetical protein
MNGAPCYSQCPWQSYLLHHHLLLLLLLLQAISQCQPAVHCYRTWLL